MLFFFCCRHVGELKNVTHQQNWKKSKERGERERGENCICEMWLKTETSTTTSNRTGHFLLLSLYSLLNLKVYIYTLRVCVETWRTKRLKKKDWRIETTYWQNMFIRVFYCPVSLSSNNDVFTTNMFIYLPLFILLRMFYH